MPFVDSNLPLVIVQTGGIPIPLEPKIAATIRVLRDPSGGRSNLQTTPVDFAGRAGIERRGHYSEGYPKKQYGLETRDASGSGLSVSLLGMPAEEDWILKGPYRDKIMFRECLRLRVEQPDGALRRTDTIRRGLRRHETGTGAIEDHYVGLFVLMERIKRGASRVDVQPLSGRFLPQGISGGWIVKVDKGDDPFFTTASGVRILHVYPEGDTVSATQRAWIKKQFDGFEAALNTPGGNFADFIDVSSFVDHFVINEVMKNVDTYRISAYMFKDRESRLEMGPVWDFDLSSTSVARGGERSDGWVARADLTGDDWKRPVWWDKLMANQNFVQPSIARWRFLRNDVLRLTNLFALIDGWASLLDGAQVWTLS